jgi:predicted DNA-binding ribbon-helix-helix protein
MTVRRLVYRGFVGKKGRTSLGLEPELWGMLAEIGNREGKKIGTLLRQLDATDDSANRASAIRIYIATYFQAAATKPGHIVSGHGPNSADPFGRETESCGGFSGIGNSVDSSARARRTSDRQPQPQATAGPGSGAHISLSTPGLSREQGTDGTRAPRHLPTGVRPADVGRQSTKERSRLSMSDDVKRSGLDHLLNQISRINLKLDSLRTDMVETRQRLTTLEIQVASLSATEGSHYGQFMQRLDRIYDDTERLRADLNIVDEFRA